MLSLWCGLEARPCFANTFAVAKLRYWSFVAASISFWRIAAAPRGRSTILPSSRSHRVCNDLAERFEPSFSAFAAQLFAPSVLTSLRNCASSDADHGFGFGLLGSFFTTRRFFWGLASDRAASAATGICDKATVRSRLVDSNIRMLAENALSQMLSSESILPPARL